MKFGQMMRQARESRNITGEELSSILGVARTYVSNLENGKQTPPGAGKISQLCAVLGVDPVPFYTQAALEKTAIHLKLDCDEARRLGSLVQLVIEEHKDKAFRVCEAIEAILSEK